MFFDIDASSNWAHRYTNGTGLNQFFSNADVGKSKPLAILHVVGIDRILRRAGDVNPLIDRVVAAEIRGLTSPARLMPHAVGIGSFNRVPSG